MVVEASHNSSRRLLIDVVAMFIEINFVDGVSQCSVCVLRCFSGGVLKRMTLV